ncbi:cytochrome c oxidase assembly protein [Acidobacteria bacterium AB60]|nr:cytochrome c oxidase assembly protein [Acidobacteria bacterium AB60]
MQLPRLLLEASEPALDLLHGWSFPVVPATGLGLALLIYLRGWMLARRTRPSELPPWRALSFSAGVLSLWIALASPLDALDDYLLAAHMIQHFLLMSIAPPLLMLGAPTAPLLRGLPRALIRFPGSALLRAPWFRALARLLTHPVFAWLAMNIAYLGWHVPALFSLTFQSEWIHNFEHLCFLLTSLAFWWVVLAPWPARPRWPRWTIIPYLLTADLLNTILSATLAFSGKVLYPAYAAAPRISGLSPLKDQVAAGAEMWVLNSIVFLIPAVGITLRLLTPKALRPENAARARSGA